MKRPRLRYVAILGLLAVSALLIAVWMTRWHDPRADSLRRSPADSVVFITIDTIRADRIGAYGATGAETPTFDQLARTGILFESAYAVAPLTLVAHASLLTGVYPPEHGVRNNGIHTLADTWTTLPEILGARGIRTAAFVAATVLDKRYGLAQGFELYEDNMRAERSSAAAVDRPATAVTEAAMRWLTSIDPDERFFLWIHYFDPHAPYAPPEPFRARSAERPYDGEIAYVDSEVGRLLRHERVALDDALAVILVGDHGESFGEHGEQTHGMLPYDATLRIPWIMKLAGGPLGERSKEPVDQVDFFPTVLGLMGVDHPTAGSGRNLLGTGSAGDLVERPLYAETYAPHYSYGWAKLRSLRVGSTKYVDAPRPELYFLHADPDELTNLFESERATALQLRQQLERLFPAGSDSEAAGSIELDREARDRLRALGYLGGVGDGAAAGDSGGDPKDLMAVHVELENANQLLLSGNHEAAVAHYERALRVDPANLRALSDLATAQATGGRLKEGIQTLEGALELAPENAQLHLQRAAFGQEQGDVEGALRHLDLALGLSPSLLEARLDKASYLGRLGRMEEAAALLDETLERHPDDAEANVLFAQLVEMRSGNFEAAEARLRQAAARDPYLASAWRALANLLDRLGRVEDAQEALEAGLARLPDDADLHGRLGLLLARADAPATGFHLREAIRLSGASRPDLEATLASWLAAHPEVEIEDRRLALQPDDGALHARNRRAVETFQQGDAKAAVSALEALVAEHPDYAPAWINLSWIALDGDRFEAAAHHARRALALDPTLGRAWNNLGHAREAQGRVAEAEEAYRGAIANDADDWQARLRLSVLLIENDRETEASTELARVEELTTSNPEARFQLARLYDARGDGPRARLHYQAVVRLAPNHPLAAAAEERLRAAF